MMKRKPSARLSPEMAAHIRYLIKDQGLFQHQVAALLEINQGRVSEVMKGQHFPTVPPSQGSFPF
jgi:predicted XRE-type DNA-binding protein